MSCEAASPFWFIKLDQNGTHIIHAILGVAAILATSSSNNSSKILPIAIFLSSILVFTQATISLLDLTSHIPSHPITIKSMFSFFIFMMSGFAVIICSSGNKFLLYLYYRSPKARLRFKLPFTLPKLTYPPALRMRSNSILSSGLWSLLSSFV